MASHSNTATSSSPSGRNNLLLLLVIVVVGGVWTYLMFIREKRVPIDAEAVAAEAKERLLKNSPEIRREAKTLAADVIPPISSALYEHARQDYPRYLAAMKEEGSTYGSNVREIMIAKTKAQYRDFVRRHRDVLAEEFPQQANDEALDKMIGEFEELADFVVDRYYLEEFRHEGERTVRYWKRFEPVPPPEIGDPPLEEQLLSYLADWSVLAFADAAKRQVEIE